MKKNLYLLTLILTLFSGMAAAQSPLKMAFLLNDGGTRAIDADALTINVANNQLTATNSTETLQLDLATLTKMYFTTEVAAIDFALPDVTDAPVAVFTLDGKHLGSFNTEAQAVAEPHQSCWSTH
ncbi:MAG: hypothetical protein NC338_08570 [Firmicutes bacterium]|nr:hypothetical protein [Bacillota bacterium]MCM1402056.1 hypothetical protein [Bacteroides sp.]MCM1477980.1 hypothetical protein [Bacteroides sp.]